jgi:hypothetical protein
MRLNQINKIYVIDQDPFIRFDLVDSIASTLPCDASALLKKINIACFAEMISESPDLLDRYC